jgi:hypothetical protein
LVQATGYEAFLFRLSHPLGEHVIVEAKALPTPPAQLCLDSTGHPTRVHAAEALRGKSGYLTLARLRGESCEEQGPTAERHALPGFLRDLPRLRPMLRRARNEASQRLTTP